MLPDGGVTEFSRLVPAIPAFEDAAAAFSRNTLLTTGRGLMAVGDLWPGEMIRTATSGFQRLLWKGSTMLVPEAKGQDPAMGRLTRIAGDSFGIARPMPDLVLGPRARLTHRASGIHALTGSEAALIPARDFIDGINVIEIAPATPVQIFHLGFAQHERILAHGIEVESLHPGPGHLLGLRGEMLALYLSCFPHVTVLADFGPLTLPRLRLQDLELFNVA